MWDYPTKVICDTTKKRKKCRLRREETIGDGDGCKSSLNFSILAASTVKFVGNKENSERSPT